MEPKNDFTMNQLVNGNLALTSTSHEYSITVPAGARGLRFNVRPNADSAKVYWYLASVGDTDVTGQSTVPWNTIGTGGPTEEQFQGALHGGQKVYFQTSHSSEVLEYSYII